jgi:hypothetical protein
MTPISDPTDFASTPVLNKVLRVSATDGYIYMNFFIYKGRRSKVEGGERHDQKPKGKF